MPLSIEKFAAQLTRAVPFAEQFGIQITSARAGVVTVEMAISAQHLRPGGSVSGPVMMTMVDLLAYACILNQHPEAVEAVTVSQNNQFLSRPTVAPLKGKGTLVKVGKKLAFIEIVLYQLSIANPVCMASSIYAMPPGLHA